MRRKAALLKGATAAAAALGAAVGALPAKAQKAQLERVEITGSALRHVDAAGALPMTVLRVEDLRRQGVTTAEQAVRRLTFNSALLDRATSVGAVTGGKVEADLRGLGSPFGSNGNKTLILLNGKRLANHSFDASAADLNAIPLAAVDRIEVLRDGASSLYGSDAIGGVINFILKREAHGLQLDAERQMPQHGGGETDRLSATGGFGKLDEHGYSVVAAIDWRRQHRLKATERSFADTGILRGDVLRGTSSISFPGSVNGFDPSLEDGCAPPNSIPGPDGAGGTVCRYDVTRDVDLIPRNEQSTALVRGNVALEGGHTGSLEVLSAFNRTRVNVAPSPSFHLIPASSPFYPDGAPVEDIPDLNDPSGQGTVPGGFADWRTVPLGLRQTENRSRTDRLMAELRGPLAGRWDYRASVGRSRNESREYVRGGYAREALIEQGVFDGVLNPFGPQTAAGQALIDTALVNAKVQSSESAMNFVDVSATTELMQTAAGPVALALGAELRRERAGFDAFDIAGDLASLGIDPDSDTEGKRRIRAMYAELQVPITRELDLTLAGRYDHYSDFGSTFNPKVAAAWKARPGLLLRASATTGYRAPSLYELHQPRSLTFTRGIYDDPLLCPRGTPVAGHDAEEVCGQPDLLARYGGPEAAGRSLDSLKPEESRSATIGLVAEPFERMNFSLDFWHTEVRRLIGLLPEAAIFEDPAKYGARIIRCSQVSAEEQASLPNCAEYPRVDGIAYIDTPNENLGRLVTQGFDISIGWRSPATAYGAFALALDGTYVARYEYQRERGGEYVNARSRFADTAPIFRWQHLVTATWSQGSWIATLAQRHKSGYTDQNPEFDVGSYTLHDLTVAWSGTRQLTLMGGVTNLFDKDPPLSVQNVVFQRGYDPRFTDPLGRTFLVRLEYRFQ